MEIYMSVGKMVRSYMHILYTALNLPSLIFAQKRYEIDLPSLEFAHSPIFLHNP